jgi:thymidylate synthase
MERDAPWTHNASTLSSAYPDLLALLTNHGTPYEKRDGKILELHPFMLVLSDPSQHVLTVEGRVCNPGFMVAEAIWILSGSDAAWIFQYNSRLRRWADSDRIVGAYGPRLRRWQGSIDQLANVVKRLESEPGSQRATVAIFDPAIDQEWHGSVPCTNLIRFMIRNGRLDMTTVMRAQDVWLGLPYDYFTFSLLHELVSGFLGVELGTYFHFMDVFRLYEPQWARAKGIRPARTHDTYAPGARLDWAGFSDIILTLAAFASDPIDSPIPSGLPGVWMDFALTLRSYCEFRRAAYEEAVESMRSIQGPLKWLLLRWFEAHAPRSSNMQTLLSNLTKGVKAR